MRTVVVDEPIEEIEESIDYSQYTVAELKSIADEKGIKYNSNSNNFKCYKFSVQYNFYTFTNGIK